MARNLLSTLKKSGGNIGMVSVRVSVRPSVRSGFPAIVWKSNHSINFEFYVGICWVSVQNWLAFGWHWPNFGALVAKDDLKWAKKVVSDHHVNKYSHNLIQICGVHLLGECSEIIHVDTILAL